VSAGDSDERRMGPTLDSVEMTIIHSEYRLCRRKNCVQDETIIILLDIQTVNVHITTPTLVIGPISLQKYP
jgi:hypothetical protein